MSKQLPQELAAFREEILQATVGSGRFIPAWLIIENKYFHAQLTALLCDFKLKGDFICLFEGDIYLFTRRPDKGWDITYCDRAHVLIYTSLKTESDGRSKIARLRNEFPQIEWVHTRYMRTPFMGIFQEKINSFVGDT
jgi:hypothetical protein